MLGRVGIHRRLGWMSRGWHHVAIQPPNSEAKGVGLESIVCKLVLEKTGNIDEIAWL